MNFASDNVFGVHPAIMAALEKANHGTSPSYAGDDYTRRAEEALSKVFEREVKAFLVTTGTAANALALSAISPPYGAIFAHAEAHCNVDECGAPELLTGGAKMIGLQTPGGKITPQAIAAKLSNFIRGEHDPKPAAVTITQATELGTIYRPAEIAAISALARARGMRLHMDGARFANALVASGVTPAELTWNAGIDVMSFGATKNGAMALEAVVFFDTGLAEDFAWRRMRAGQLLSKGRFLGAQMLAYLEGGLWLDNARHANAMAKRLAAGLEGKKGVRLPLPTEANEVFAVLPRPVHEALEQKGAVYHMWPGDGPEVSAIGPEEVFVRFVASFATAPGDVDRLLAAVLQ
jgi:threonine aldolase